MFINELLHDKTNIVISAPYVHFWLGVFLGIHPVSYVVAEEALDLTVMTLSFWTDWSEQTVQTQIRHQGLHCLIAIPFASF